MIFDLYYPIRTKDKKTNEERLVPGTKPCPNDWGWIVNNILKSQQWNEQIDKFRETGDGALKAALPAICFVGRSTSNRQASAMVPTQLFMIDIDHCDDPRGSWQKMVEMVENLRTALGERIAALEWMSDETKAKAHEKLNTFTVKIGYPDKWKDYSSLNINPALSYWENIKRANAWFAADNLAELGKEVDREKWFMSPQTVNAYYNPTTNEICFPAAILQPPFYNSAADDAVNYGAIGVVIGHEMTHGFDDQGRQFDKDGNMNNWWTEEDAAAFKSRTDVLVEQFNKIEVLPAKGDQPAIMADGALSLGENIADQGGLRVAYTALQNSFGEAGKPEPIDGFTAEQRFYLSYATIWGQNIRDEEIARLTKVDVHSLGRNRVNATLRNIESFYEAFGISDGEMFLPESERIIIW